MNRDSSWRRGGEGLVARWTLDSADRRQTLLPGLLQELAEGACDAVRRGVRVVVVDSANSRVFASGAPLDVIRSIRSAAAWEFAAAGQKALDLLSQAPAWIVAEIEGACVGGGLDLALACDIRIVSSQSSFIHPGTRLGIVTGWGGTWRARCLLGVGASRRLFERAEVLSAPDALHLGLADHVVPACEFRARCDQIEHRLADGIGGGPYKVKR